MSEQYIRAKISGSLFSSDGNAPAVSESSSPCACRRDEAMTREQLIEELKAQRHKVGQLEREQKETQEHLKRLETSEEKYRRVVAESPIGITVYDSTGQCTAANTSMAEMIGAEPQQVLAQNFHNIESWKASGLYDSALLALSAKKTQQIDTGLFTSTFGKQVYLSCYLVPFPSDGLFFMAHDRTAQRTVEALLEKKTAELQSALMEKEVLLTEIHHRVKNNLATISAILQMQSHMLDDRQFRDILHQCQSRINSMALVHEHLYGCGNFGSVDLKNYIDSLLSMISEGHQYDGDKIKINSNIADISLDLEQLISIGMIINEAVTNALKHAFTRGEGGTIDVSISKVNDDVAVSIKDDGIGVSDADGTEHFSSFGFKLMNIFTRQLKGEINMSHDAGTMIDVKFRNGRHQ